MFEKPDGSWELVSFAQSSRDDEAVERTDLWAVESFLRECKSNFTVMANLRAVLGTLEPVSRFTDDEVAADIAAKLARRELLLRRPGRRPKAKPEAPKEESETQACPLRPPSGRYTVKHGAVALFAPEMALKVNAAFAELNKKGIVPRITSGFRTATEQASLRKNQADLKKTHQDFGAAKCSWHEVGQAIDIHQLHHASKESQEVVSAMTKAGLTWGGTFTKKDPVHFQNATRGTRPDPNLAAAYAKANSK